MARKAHTDAFVFVHPISLASHPLSPFSLLVAASLTN